MFECLKDISKYLNIKKTNSIYKKIPKTYNSSCDSLIDIMNSNISRVSINYKFEYSEFYYKQILLLYKNPLLFSKFKFGDKIDFNFDNIVTDKEEYSKPLGKFTGKLNTLFLTYNATTVAKPNIIVNYDCILLSDDKLSNIISSSDLRLSDILKLDKELGLKLFTSVILRLYNKSGYIPGYSSYYECPNKMYNSSDFKEIKTSFILQKSIDSKNLEDSIFDIFEYEGDVIMSYSDNKNNKFIFEDSRYKFTIPSKGITLDNYKKIIIELYNYIKIKKFGYDNINKTIFEI